MDQNPTPAQTQSSIPASTVPMPPVIDSTPPTSSSIPPTSPNNPNIPNKNNKKKFIIIAVIAFTVLLLGSAAAYFILKKDTPKPANSATQAKDTKKAAETKPVNNPNAIANCLRPNDYLAVRDKDSLPEYYGADIEATTVGETIFFKPNSTDYEYPDQIAIFDKYAAFYKKNKEKSWTFEIQGQVKDVANSGNSADNNKLANDRAQKVKTELVSRGFDGGRITVLEPEVYSSELGPDDSNRNVSMSLSSQCIKDKEYNQ